MTHRRSEIVRISRASALALAVLFLTINPEPSDGFVPFSSRHLHSMPRSIRLSTTAARVSRSNNNNQDEFDLPSSFFFQDGDDRGEKFPTNPLNFESSSAALNEYDRDAEFYRQRNLEYYNSLQRMQQQDEYTFNELGKQTTQQQPQNEQTQKLAEDTINSVLKSSQASFKNVEQLTFGLLQQRPFVALGIFLAAGALVAYLTGFFILDGYIDSLNPAENDAVPYWNEPEIHTITRKP